VRVPIDKAGRQRPAAEIHELRGRPLCAVSTSAFLPIARILPSSTASASALGWASLTVTMGPPK